MNLGKELVNEKYQSFQRGGWGFLDFLRPKIIDRYIISECLLPFSAGCGIVTGIWLGADKIQAVFKILTSFDVNFTIPLAFIGLALPQILLTTIPLGIFLGTFLVFNRLSSDSELIAMRASGISLWRIIFPAVGFGALMLLLSLFISEFLLSWSYETSINLTQSIVKNVPLSSRRTGDFFFMERIGKHQHEGSGVLNRIFHASAVDSEKGELQKVTILDFSNKELRQIHYAKAASFDKENGKLYLHDSTVYSFAEKGQNSQASHFDKLSLPMYASFNELSKDKKTAQHMSINQLGKLLREYNKLNLESPELPRWTVLFHNKISYLFTCIMMALAGAPLGIMPKRSRTNWGYILTGGIVFIFFSLQSILVSTARNDKIDPMLAAWIPNLFMLLIGTYFIWKKSDFAD